MSSRKDFVKGEQTRNDFQCKLRFPPFSLACFHFFSSHILMLRGGQTNISFSSSFHKTFKLILYPFLNTKDVDRTLISILMMAFPSQKGETQEEDEEALVEATQKCQRSKRRAQKIKKSDCERL